MAYLVRLAISAIPSFSLIRYRWHAAVLKEIPNERAIAFVESPEAISFSTSSSLGVNRSTGPLALAIYLRSDIRGRAGASAIRSAARGSRRRDPLPRPATFLSQMLSRRDVRQLTSNFARPRVLVHPEGH